MLLPIITRHAEDAAFYWARCIDGSLSSQHDTRSLRRFAGLLEGHLEGLRVAQIEGQIHAGSGDSAVTFKANVGWQATWTRLSQWKTSDESFVASVIALEAAAAQDLSLLTQVEELACDQYDDSHGQNLDVARGLASAAAWLPWPLVHGAVMRWAQSQEPVLRQCAVSGCALHRLPDSSALGAWLDDPHAIVRERALKAAGELGCRDLQAQMIARLQMNVDVVLDPTEADISAFRQMPSQEQFWAAWSLCMLGCTEGIATLLAWIEHPSNQDKHLADRRLQAIAAICQVMPSDVLDALIVRWFGQSPVAPDSAAARQRNNQRHALDAMRFSGDLRWLNTLLDLIVRETQADAVQNWFASPGGNLSRQAADVYAHLSGAVIGEQLWMQAPEPAQESEKADEHEHEHENDHVHPTHAQDMQSNPAVPLSYKHDPDDGLLWPHSEAINAWHGQNTTRFAQLAQANSAVVRGKVLSLSHAQQLMGDPLAGQLQRYHTALFLHAGKHTTALINTRVLTSK